MKARQLKATKTIDISDGICVYLQGGLGNQLFIIAAGLEQALRLKCKLYIDISNYAATSNVVTTRNYELEELDIPGQVICQESPWFGRNPNSYKDRLITRYLLKQSNYVFVEQSLEYDPKINQIGVGTTLIGFFQNTNYMPTSLQILKQLLVKHRESLLKERTHNAEVGLHARRGDLLKTSNIKYHGICSTQYYFAAVNLISNLFENPDIDIYSDSPELFSKEIENLGFPRYEFANQSNSTLNDMLKLSNHEALVISNSTFSWWAGILMEQDKVVISPQVWLAEESPLDDLAQELWIKLPK